MKRLLLALCLLAGPAFANDWDALDQPGAIAIMRHALAPGTGDPANLTVGDCSTQRNIKATTPKSPISKEVVMMYTFILVFKSGLYPPELSSQSGEAHEGQG